MELAQPKRLLKRQAPVQRARSKLAQAAGVALLLGAGAAWGQATWPARPVTIVVPLAPGGPVDTEARAYGQKLAEYTGGQFLVDNRAGASGTIANAMVARAQPDGHTLLLASASFTIVPSFFRNLDYDPVRDFQPVSMMGVTPVLLLATPGLAARNLGEVVELARTRPGELNFGTTGSGGAIHLAGAYLSATTGSKLTFVHYKGTAPLMTDLMEGRLQLGMSNLISGLALIKGGKLRALGVSGAARLKSMPELPTLAEQGAANYSYYGWTGFLAPQRTPATVTARIQGELAKVARAPDVTTRFAPQGTEVVGGTSEALGRFIAEDIQRWRRIVQDFGITQSD